MVAIIISVLSITISIVTFIISVRLDCKKMTIDAYRDLQKFLYVFYEYSKGEIEEFVSADDDSEYKVLSTSLAEVEFFATGVRNHVYSKTITYKMAHGFLDGSIRGGIEHLIDIKNRYTDRKGFYNNTIWLLKEMDKKTKRGS